MKQDNYAVLNARHGIEGEVQFTQGPGGLTQVEVTHARARAVIAIQGAQLLSYARHDEPAVVWVSPQAKYSAGKSVRGGVPICWPWFGPHASDPALPTHGYARTLPWEVVQVVSTREATQLVFELVPDAATRARWPQNSKLECHITIGDALEMELVTRNLSGEAMSITDALHTYFGVSDVRAIRVLGLDGVEYIDKVDAGRRMRQSGDVTFNGETDRVYLNTEGDCVIEDPGYARRIRIAKRGSRSTVVWNPWIDKAAKLGDMGDDGYLRMVCVESANALDNAVLIAPGDEHRLWVRYSVEAL